MEGDGFEGGHGRDGCQFLGVIRRSPCHLDARLTGPTGAATGIAWEACGRAPAARIVGGMREVTERLWVKQNHHDGDRLRLFAAVAGHVDATEVLYAGSYVDVAASFVFPAVTYVDADRRAARFFDDAEGVGEIVAAYQVGAGVRSIRFVAGDYAGELGLADESFDLLVSLYAGFVSEHCTRYLRVGGHLLVNPSHGDAAMASIDARHRLAAGVTSGGASGYRVDESHLDRYLVPKRPQPVTVDWLHELGREIAYTHAAFAYLFERIR